MKLIKRVHTAYLFDNGNLAAFDLAAQQIPELQGEYSIEKHKRIVLESTDDCLFKGFDILPNQFLISVNQYAEYYRSRDLSWDDIKNL